MVSPKRKSSARLWTWISSRYQAWWFQIFFIFTQIPVTYGSKWGHFEESGSQFVILSKHLSGSSSGAQRTHLKRTTFLTWLVLLAPIASTHLCSDQPHLEIYSNNFAASNKYGVWFGPQMVILIKATKLVYPTLFLELKHLLGVFPNQKKIGWKMKDTSPTTHQATFFRNLEFLNRQTGWDFLSFLMP